MKKITVTGVWTISTLLSDISISFALVHN